MFGIVRNQKKWYSRNNRRLWCFEEGNVEAVEVSWAVPTGCTCALRGRGIVCPNGRYLDTQTDTRHRQTNKQTDRQTDRHACMHACMYAYVHTCTHANMHTCIHAYIHTARNCDAQCNNAQRVTCVFTCSTWLKVHIAMCFSLKDGSFAPFLPAFVPSDGTNFVIPLPQIMEEMMEVVQIIPQEFVQNRTVEQFVDVSIHQIQEETSEALQFSTQEHTSVDPHGSVSRGSDGNLSYTSVSCSPISSVLRHYGVSDGTHCSADVSSSSLLWTTKSSLLLEFPASECQTSYTTTALVSATPPSQALVSHSYFGTHFFFC